MTFILIAILLTYLIVAILPRIWQWISNVWNWLWQRRRKLSNRNIFYGNYIEVKTFYQIEFNQTPCMSYIDNLNLDKAFEYIINGNAGVVIATYQRNYYNWQNEKQEFATTIFKLKNKVMIELCRESAEILFDQYSYDYANNLIQVFSGFKAVEKDQDFEINIISMTSIGLELKQLAIKPTILDIDLYYNDDFKVVDALIRERLGTYNDKGIVLLHGLPGTGKTTYLRHLIGSLKKKVLFVSPGVAGNLMNPELMDLLIDNPNAILVIEDAENIIMDRKFSSNSSVSNLLNISDGLLSDCLNVQIICTFNSSLNVVDSALLRKGRLIAKYEFGKLDIAKAQKLSDHLGLNQKVLKPMTLAELTNPDNTNFQVHKTTLIGFRRMEELVDN